MDENPNPTWLARLLFVFALFVTVGLFLFLAYGLLFGPIRKKDFEDFAIYIIFFGVPAAAACLSAACYYVIIGNTKPQDITTAKNIKEAYGTYMFFSAIAAFIGYLFIARS